MSKPFPFAERAHAARQAHAALHESFAKVRWREDQADPATRRWLAAVAAFNAAVKLAYAPDFWNDLRKTRAGDACRLDRLIDFLEADPLFFGSGYAKAQVIAAIKRYPFTRVQAERMREVLLSLVVRRDDREFRKFCRLAPKVETPAFRQELEALAESDNRNVARRARWVLAAIRISQSGP